MDGAYGRHYTFLKAVTALWQVLVDPDVRGTFKIDLDQVFPQAELVAETGASAFEHLETPLWGALGVDPDGRELELGMIAGALVNERDIGRGRVHAGRGLSRWAAAARPIRLLQRAAAGALDPCRDDGALRHGRTVTGGRHVSNGCT